jgi:hypothetical protein
MLRMNKFRKRKILSGLTRIPFVLIETNKSLMEDIADYQIALLILNQQTLAIF